MSSGVIHIKEMAKYGFIFNIIGIVSIVLITNFFWKNVL